MREPEIVQVLSATLPHGNDVIDGDALWIGMWWRWVRETLATKLAFPPIAFAQEFPKLSKIAWSGDMAASRQAASSARVALGFVRNAMLLRSTSAGASIAARRVAIVGPVPARDPRARFATIFEVDWLVAPLADHTFSL
jgi:hypothetical protein